MSAEGTVASVRGGASITSADLIGEVLLVPPRAQAQVVAHPADLANFAQNMLVRRELARQAEVDRLQNDPAIAAALSAARERVLAEAMLTRAGGNPPEQAALERLARNQYDAAPEKFTTPEEVRVSHILIHAKACEAEARAREVLALARQPGADFAALAKEKSDDAASAAKGGDLGFFSRGKMAPAFESAAFALKQPGQLSDVVKTEFGYHVIRLEERKPAARQPFEAVREGLMKNFTESEARARRQQVLDRVNAGIEIDQKAIEALVAAEKSGAKPN
jgi:peptidyl-prolyl cis-trans isomerase C